MCAGYTEVFSWGGDHSGQLGQPSKPTNRTATSPRPTHFSLFIREVSCGEDHAVFITQEGEVYSLGSNAEGRLGVGSRTLKQSNSPLRVDTLAGCKAMTLSCGWTHTAVLTDSGEMYTWGSGETGALGLGATDNQWLPVLVKLPKDLAPMSVACGARHSVILGNSRSSGRETWSCGCGEAGQLGTGRRDKELTFVRISTPEPIAQASCGVFHTGLLSVAGRVYTMGGNSFGQLGLGSKKSSSLPQRLTALDNSTITKISCGSHSAAVSDRGELFLWGSGPFGEFLTPQQVDLPVRVMDVAVGGTFAAALDVNHSVWTWGSNTSGELGLGDYDQRAAPSLVTTLQGKQVRMLACGVSFCISLGQDCGLIIDDTPIKQHSRPQSRAGERIPSRATHTRSITATSFDPSKSPLRPRDNLPILDPAEREVSKSFQLPPNRNLNIDFSKRNADLVSKIEDLQRLLANEQATNKHLHHEHSIRESALASDKQRLSTEVQELQISLENANSSLFELQSALRSKEKEAGLIRASCEEVAEERDKLSDIVTERERRLETLIKELAAVEESSRREIDAKEEEMGKIRLEAEREKRKAEEIISQFKRESEDLRFHCERLSEEIRRQETHMTSEIDKLALKLQANQEEMRTISSAKDSLLAEISTLRDVILSKEEEITTLHRDTDLLTREKRAALSDLNQLQLLILACEGETETAVRDKEALASDLQQARDSIRTLSEELDAVEKEKEQERRSVEGLKSALEDLRERIEVESRRREEEGVSYRGKLQLLAREKGEIEENWRKIAREKGEMEENMRKLAREKGESDENLRRFAREKGETEENLKKVTRENDDLKGRNKRLDETLNQAKDRFQSDLARKDDENERLVETYERKVSVLSRELIDLKSMQARQEATAQEQIQKTEANLRSTLEELEELKEEKAGLAQKLLLVEGEKQSLDQDLDSALRTMQQMEGNGRMLQQKLDSGERDIRLLRQTDSQHQKEIEELTILMGEEKEKRLNTEKEAAADRRRAEDQAESWNRRQDGLNKENERLRSVLQEREKDLKTVTENARSAERKWTNELDSLRDDLQRAQARHQLELQSKSRDLQLAMDKLRATTDENTRLSASLERSTEERSNMQKQIFEAERLKRGAEDLNEKLQTANRRVEELRGRNVELEGKNRDLFIRLERARASPSPLRSTQADLSSPLRSSTVTFKASDARISSGKWTADPGALASSDPVPHS